MEHAVVSEVSDLDFSTTELRRAMIIRGLGPKSIKDYLGAIGRAADWVSVLRNVTLDTADEFDLHAYAEAAVPNSWSSRKLARTALSLYYEVTLAPTNPARAIRVPPKPRFECRALTDDEAHALAVTAYGWDEGAEGVAVLFGLHEALRAHEIAKVRWDDIDGEWLNVMGKGSVQASVPLHPRVLECLDWWRGFRVLDPTDCRTRPGDEYVFQGRGSRYPHVTPATVWSWTKRLAKVAGVRGLTTHRLRHTAGALANDRSGDLRATQAFLRHASPETTVLYTRVRRDRLRGVVLDLNYGVK